MKIALVKQDVYQDLYVCANRSKLDELLFSSEGRVGMFSLFSLFDADFYIVEEENTAECRMWKKVIPHMAKEYERLKTETLDKLKGMSFHEPGSDKPNGFYAVKCDEIDWSKYDVVISINISVPTRIVQKYPNTLWAYMIGEANFMQDKVYFGYVVNLNQLITGTRDKVKGYIDFPYTFVGPICLETLMEDVLKRKSKNTGIYAEINTTKERPVKRVPHFEPIGEATGHPIIVHQQLIRRNLEAIFDSKYYLKVGGRHTRGNGVLEAISLGTVCLLSPDDLICPQVLPPEAWVFTVEEATEKIKYLDSHSDEYQKLLEKERMLVDQFVIKYPMHYLELALKEKRQQGKPNHVYKYGMVKFGSDVLKKGVYKIKRDYIKR